MLALMKSWSYLPNFGEPLSIKFWKNQNSCLLIESLTLLHFQLVKILYVFPNWFSLVYYFKLIWFLQKNFAFTYFSQAFLVDSKYVVKFFSRFYSSQSDWNKEQDVSKVRIFSIIFSISFSWSFNSITFNNFPTFILVLIITFSQIFAKNKNSMCKLPFVVSAGFLYKKSDPWIFQEYVIRREK